MKLQLLALLPVALAVVVNPLPKPVEVDWKDQGLKHFDTSLRLIQSGATNNYVSTQFQDMVQTIEKTKWYPKAVDGPRGSYESNPTSLSDLQKRQSPVNIDALLTELYVEILDDKPLQYGVDESYKLCVDDKISISSNTTWGALHALKTLQQLVIYENGSFYIEDAVEIFDKPLFSHRGVLIDSGRNFLSLESIKENIDLMSLAKANTLHWHLADTQSWPIDIEAYPEMVEDAYSSSEKYTRQKVRELIEYAKSKGVRIVPEIDMPGHSNAGWRLIDPDLVSCGKGWWNSGIALEPPAGQLDIAYNKTYEVIETIFDELNELFEDNYFHVGHDELQKGCYNFSVNVWDWYDSNSDGEMDFNDLIQYWVDKSYPIFTKNESTKLIMWQDLITNNGIDIPKDVLLQVWLEADTVKNLTSEGYDVIVSSYEHYYLDCGFGGWVTNYSQSAGSWCDPYKNWQNIYSYDYFDGLSDTQKDHIKGIEVALWSELADSYNLVQKIWSRAASFAESS